MYNMLYTAQPVIAMAVFDQDVSADTSARYPPLYEPGMRDMYFSRLKFAFSAWEGLWTSFVLVAITLGISPFPSFSPPSVSSLVVNACYLVCFSWLTTRCLHLDRQLRQVCAWCFSRIFTGNVTDVSNHVNFQGGRIMSKDHPRTLWHHHL